MQNLPEEIVNTICNFLHEKDLFAVSVISKKFLQIMENFFREKVGRISYRQICKLQIVDMFIKLKNDLHLFPNTTNEDLFSKKFIITTAKKIPKEISFLENCEKLKIKNKDDNRHCVLPEKVPPELILDNCEIDECPKNVKILTLLNSSLKSASDVESLIINGESEYPSLKSFSNLTKLKFASSPYPCTQIETEFPPNLKTLICSFNHFKEVPSGSENLEKVVLYHDEIEIFPTNLGTIRELHLGANKIKCLPDVAMGENLCTIRELHSGTNKIKCFPDVIVSENLEILHLNRNKLEEIPSSIGMMKKLRILDVSSCKIRKISFSIATLDYLEEINLANNNLQCVPEAIVKVSSLRKLILDCNKIKIMPKCLFDHKNLTLISLKHNVGLIFNKKILTMPSLKKLLIDGCGCTNIYYPESDIFIST